MISVERGLALLSVLLLAVGAGALFSAYFPRWDNTPKTPTMIWAGPVNKIERSEALVIIYLPGRDTSKYIMLVSYTLTPLDTTEYYFDIWTPYRIGPNSYSRIYNGPGNATPPTIVSLRDGTYWISVNASLDAYIPITIDVYLQVPDIFSIHDPGKDTIVITFWGNIRTDEELRIEGERDRVNSTEIFDHIRRFLVIVQFPNDTVLTSDTFPPPTSVYITGNSKWADWLLNFTSPLSGYGQGILISMSSPNESRNRDLALFFGGVLISLGAGGAFEWLRDHFRDKRSARGSKRVLQLLKASESSPADSPRRDMKDDEARYLIDQYNKYASWGARRDEVFTGAYFALGIACLAVVVSIWNQVLPTERRTSAFNIVLVVLLLLICVFFGSYLLVRRRYNCYQRTLGMLEGYRSKHKSLPDGITFRLVIDKPEEVKKQLEQNESNLRTPPQT